jgi:hypothetical protein
VAAQQSSRELSTSRKKEADYSNYTTGDICRRQRSPSYTGRSSPSSRSSSDLSFVIGSGSSWDLACDLDWVLGSGSSSDSDSSSGSSCGLDAENPAVAAQQSSRELSTSRKKEADYSNYTTGDICRRQRICSEDNET